MNTVTVTYVLGLIEARLVDALDRAEQEIKNPADEYGYIRAKAVLAVAASEAIGSVRFVKEEVTS